MLRSLHRPSKHSCIFIRMLNLCASSGRVWMPVGTGPNYMVSNCKQGCWHVDSCWEVCILRSKAKGMFSLEKKRLEWYKVEGREWVAWSRLQPSDIWRAFIWMRNRLALQCFTGWKKYDWKLEGRKILVKICQTTLIVAILAVIYKPSPCARYSTKLFWYITLLI